MNDYKKYLPSKKFTFSLLFIIVLIVFFFLMKELFSLTSSFFGKKTKGAIPVQVTIAEKIQKDSNNNGIPDWEEYLWGLDAYKNGPENKDFILAKKQSLAQNSNNPAVENTTTISQNEALSRSFFAAIVSLQQTGELNADTMKSVSEAVGKSVAVTDIKDIYTPNMQKVQNDSLVANKAYYDALGKLVTKYTDYNIGSELTFIVQGINNKDPQALYTAKTVASAYQSFGKELIAIPVPNSIAPLALSASNNYEKTGRAIMDLATSLNDPIVGMSAILNYKKYNEALGSDLEKIGQILQ